MKVVAINRDKQPRPDDAITAFARILKAKWEKRDAEQAKCPKLSPKQRA